MEDQKSLGRGLEEISTQFLSTPGEEHQLEQLIKRLERLENRLGAKPPPEDGNHKREPAGETPPFQQYKEILTNLYAHLGQDYIASGIIGSNGLHLAFDSPAQHLDQQATSAYLAESINNTREIIDKLSLGTMESLTITSHHCHILLHSLPGENYFLCLVIKKDANIGLANLLLDKLSPRLRFTNKDKHS